MRFTSRKIYSCLFIALIACLVISTSAFALVYVVREKDSLSLIAKKYFHGSVWGENGALEKLIAQNPQIKNPNLIFPGDEVIITVENAPAPEQISEKEPINTDTVVAPLPTESGAMLEVVPFYAFTGIQATDSATDNPSTIVSSYHVGIDAIYSQQWSEVFKSFIHLKLSSISFSQPTDATRTISDSKLFLSTVGVGGEMGLSSKVKLKLGVDYGSEIFVKSSSTTNVTMNAIPLTSLHSKLTFQAFQQHEFKLGVSALGSFIFSGKSDSYEINPGVSYGGSIYLEQLDLSARKPKFITEVGYLGRSQNTSIASQNEYSIFLQIHFFLPIGGI